VAEFYSARSKDQSRRFRGLICHRRLHTGEYWTDRKTSGRMTFSARVSRLCTRYEDAERAFNF
jgi:hypothetical protein